MLSGEGVSHISEDEVVAKISEAESTSTDVGNGSISSVLVPRAVHSDSTPRWTRDTNAAAVAAIVDEVTTAKLCEVIVIGPFSNMTSLSESPPSMEGKKRVHQNAMRRPRSTRRCFKIKITIRAKNAKAAKISSRSNQSAFSSAVTSCFEAPSSPVSMSWVVDVAFSDAVDVSAITG